jgi:hypothetical protein
VTWLPTPSGQLTGAFGKRSDRFIPRLAMTIAAEWWTERPNEAANFARPINEE